MSSLDGLVAETGRVLSDARRLFGAAPLEASLPSAQQLMAGRAAVAPVGQAAAANWQGEAATTYAATNADQVHALDRTVAADGQVNPALTHAGQAAAAGARSMDNLIAQTRAGLAHWPPAHVAPQGSSNSPAFCRVSSTRRRDCCKTSSSATLK